MVVLARERLALALRCQEGEPAIASSVPKHLGPWQCVVLSQHSIQNALDTYIHTYIHTYVNTYIRYMRKYVHTHAENISITINYKHKHIRRHVRAYKHAPVAKTNEHDYPQVRASMYAHMHACTYVHMPTQTGIQQETRTQSRHMDEQAERLTKDTLTKTSAVHRGMNTIPNA